MAKRHCLSSGDKIQLGPAWRSAGPEVELERGDWERIERCAKACGIPVAEWIRAVLLAAAAPGEGGV
jgi:hypothetical protein